MKKFITHLAMVALLLFLHSALWSQSFGVSVNPVKIYVNSPDGVVTWEIDGIQAEGWGGDMNTLQTVTAKLVAMRDTSALDSLAIYCCNDAIINPGDVEGNIALISRGDCEFSDKAFHAEKNGAVASIVGNRAGIGETVGTHTDGLVRMAAGALADTVTTPSIFISHEDHIVLRDLVENGGEDVNITIAAPSIMDAAAAYAYRTPESQIVPLDDINLVAINRDSFMLFDVEFTAEITEPGGGAVTLTSTLDTLLAAVDSAAIAGGNLAGEYDVLFDSYTPSEVGEYTVTFSAATPGGNHLLDMATETLVFWITDDYTFSHDNGEVTYEKGVALTSGAFVQVSPPGVMHVGGAYRTGSSDATAISATFGLFNAESFEDGLPINIRVYDADPDGNGLIDDPFMPEAPLASVTYEITTNELPNELLTVMFDDPVTLPAGGIYLLMIETNGITDDFLESPSFTSASAPATADYGTILVFGAEYEIDGFEYWNDDTPGRPHAGRRPIARLHLDGFSSGTIEPLDIGKISVNPVPTSDFLTLNLDLENTSSEVKVAILDFHGRLVSVHQFDNVEQLKHQFDVRNLPVGNYFLSVQTEEGYRAKKFQVIR